MLWDWMDQTLRVKWTILQDLFSLESYWPSPVPPGDLKWFTNDHPRVVFRGEHTHGESHICVFLAFTMMTVAPGCDVVAPCNICFLQQQLPPARGRFASCRHVLQAWPSHWTPGGPPGAQRIQLMGDPFRKICKQINAYTFAARVDQAKDGLWLHFSFLLTNSVITFGRRSRRSHRTAVLLLIIRDLLSYVYTVLWTDNGIQMLQKRPNHQDADQD